MKWTKKKPREPGRYLVAEINNGVVRSMSVTVDLSGRELHADGMLMRWWQGFYWFGPIPEPPRNRTK